MAIDGTRIIDSDSAHDIYGAVIEGWKDGRPLADIVADVRGWEEDFCFNALETEIYWTALAFSLWKIGQLPDEVRKKALNLISQGACADWSRIDSKAQKKRQKELDALAKKISLSNPKPLARPKPPKTPKQALFAVGDVLAVALPAGQYGACVLVELDQTPRKINYHFAIVNLTQLSAPTLDDVGNAEISCPKGIGFHASCWTDDKTVSQVLPSLRRIGQVKLTAHKMMAYSPGLGADGFFNCWNGDSVSKGCSPMWDCIEKIVSTDHE